MTREFEYSPRERLWLWAVAIFGLTVANGAFLYGLVLQPGAMTEAMTNPIAVAFMAEAAILVGLLAYLLTRWRVGRLSWRWLVVLSVVGGLAFAIPVVLLWGRRRPADG